MPPTGDSATGDSATGDSATGDSAAADRQLITVAELADVLAGQEPPTLLDIRWRLGGPPGIDAYRAGDLPGAVYVDLDTQLAGPPGAGGRHPLPAAADFEAAMRAGRRPGGPRRRGLRRRGRDDRGPGLVAPAVLRLR